MSRMREFDIVMRHAVILKRLDQMSCRSKRTDDVLFPISAKRWNGALIDPHICGDVADSVKDNPALQRMLARMTMLSLLKQAGADEESIRGLNRVLQGIKK